VEEDMYELAKIMGMVARDFEGNKEAAQAAVVASVTAKESVEEKVAEAEPVKESAEEPVAPRRRGRPRKAESEGAVGEPAGDTVVVRRRPKTKKKEEKELFPFYEQSLF
jgi:hypothetical protein